MSDCHPMDCSPPSSSVHGILQARYTGVGCHALLQKITCHRHNKITSIIHGVAKSQTQLSQTQLIHTHTHSNYQLEWTKDQQRFSTTKDRNLYASQEATVRTGHGTTDWFQIGKGVRQGYILSPCLFNFYAGRSTSWNQDCQEKSQ